MYAVLDDWSHYSFVALTLAHLSDTHIGYEAYKKLSKGGENQRSVDFVKAFIAAVDDIIDNDPPLVIHAGDVADKTIIPIRLMLLIRREFARLAGLRPDGTRRQVLIVAGNHELPRNRKEACFLELIKDLPGVHVSTTSYDTFTYSDFVNCDPLLKDVVLHALPHDVLKSVDFNEVRPVEGKVNILSSHGVAGGSELFVRSLGREFPIPANVLLREWDYVALGHWHKQGPVNFGDTFTKVVDATSGKTDKRVWYSGSTENSGFGDILDCDSGRGWLKVTIVDNDLYVLPKNISIRKMFRLPEIDASGMSPDGIFKALVDNIKSVNIDGCVVGQVVNNVDREIWSLVDLALVKDIASNALHYDVGIKRSYCFNKDSVTSIGQGSSLISFVKDACSELIPTEGERAIIFDYVNSILELNSDSANTGEPESMRDEDMPYIETIEVDKLKAGE